MRNLNNLEKYLTIQDTLFTIGGKWRFPIVYTLCNGPKRFNEITRDLGGISPKMLTAELKELEIHQILIREVVENEKVQIIYRLTEHAETLRPLFEAMYKWGKIHKGYLIGKQEGPQTLYLAS